MFRINIKFQILQGCLLLLLCPLCAFTDPLQFNPRGKAALLMNADSGKILYEHQAYTPHYPASTTKIATALYALKLRGDDLDMLIEAQRDSLAMLSHENKRKRNYQGGAAYWLEENSMHIGIKPGEIFSLRDLLQATLISSGDDAANVIAQDLGPTVPVFMEGVNAYLKELGCMRTLFTNPHGLHDSRHETTPYDLALMMREALKHPVFCEMVSQTRFIRPKTNKQESSTLLQTNRLLRPGKLYYAKAIGGKTGYHSLAKKTFVGAARHHGRTLIVVLMGYDDRDALFEDAISLFEMAFNQPKVQRTFLKEGPQAFVLDLPNANRSLTTYLEEPLTLQYYPAEDPQAKCLLQWESLTLPVEKDQQVAELRLVTSNGDVLKLAPLLAAEEVTLLWSHRWLVPLSLAGGLIVLFFLVLLLKRRA